MTAAWLAGLRSRLNPARRHQVAGLDIGSSAVKVVQLEPAGSSHRLIAVGVAPLRPGAVAEGTIHDPEATVEAIRTAVDAAGLATSEVALGICGRELIVKKVQIPEVPSKELAGAVQLEAENQIPFAVDDVFLDYHVLAQQTRMLDLGLVAAKKSKVLEYHAVAAEAGLEPVVVDLDVFALANRFHQQATAGPEDTVALVDIGATMLKVSIVRAGLPLFVRDLPFGGQRYTQAIATRLHVSVEDAEAIKLGRVAAADTGAVARVCETVSRDLALELQRAFDYFASSAAGTSQIGRIVLAGGTARLHGLREYLASATGVPVEIADVGAGLEVAPACAAPLALAGPALAVALGLGLRRLGDARAA